MPITILITTENENCIPHYASKGAAGADVKANIKENITIRPGEFKLIPTGCKVEIPEGFEIQVRPRSGLSLKTGLIIKNAPGTVDQDYTGECSVIMHLLQGPTLGTGEYYNIRRGDRIAQAVLCPVVIPDLEEVTELDETERGSNGFGSSGV